MSHQDQSHQDQLRADAFGTHAHDLYQAFQWVTPQDCFKSVRFRDDCRWSPGVLVFAALVWSWSDFKRLGKRYTQAQKIIKRLLGRQAPLVSYQAFMALLGRWTEALLECLLPAYRGKIQEALPDYWRIGAWIVFAVDGSRTGVPRTRWNEERYSPKSKLSRQAQQRRRRQKRETRRKARAREQQANVPRIWMTLLWHVGSALPWDWRLGPSESSERGHLEAMLETLPQDSLLTADAGFVGYDLWRKLLQRELKLLIRVGGNVRLLQRLGVVRCERSVVYLWPDAAARRRQPPLALRLIVLGGGKHAVHLVTNLASSQLSDHEAAEIYRRRWGVEVYFRHCKQTFERGKLRSKNPDNALTELQWSLASLCVMGLYAHAHLARQGVPPERVSFSGVLEAFRDPIREYQLRPTRVERMNALLEHAVLDGYLRRNKSSRSYPRKKQHRPPSPPILLPATPEQRLNAKPFKEEMQKALTA